MKIYKVLIIVLVLINFMYFSRYIFNEFFASIPHYFDKIAFISASYSDNKSLCKKYANQRIHADFICFTNNSDPTLDKNGWSIDNTPYHLNTVKDSNHIKIERYYKLNFQSIKRLKYYKAIVWVNNTHEIKHAETADKTLDLIKDNTQIISFSHRTYESSIAFSFDGFDEKHWEKLNVNEKQLEFWSSGIFAFDNQNQLASKFLSFWFWRVKNDTIKEKVSLSYTAQKLGLNLFSFLDGF